MEGLLSIGYVIFIIGVIGIQTNRGNVVIILMSIELMLLGVNLNMVIYSVYFDDIVGQIYGLLILTVAAAESAVGLAILVTYYRVRGSIGMETMTIMQG